MTPSLPSSNVFSKQFVINEDAGIVKWGKKTLPKLQGLWNYYSGKAGIGRLVQTSFLFYGGITTTFLAYFAIPFNVFDGTLHRGLVGNLAAIGFAQVDERRLGGADLFQRAGAGCQPGLDLAHRQARPGYDPPHRARQGARAGRDGLHCGVAVVTDAGVSLCLAGWDCELFERFGVRRPARERPAVAGDYDHALHTDHPDAPSLLEQYLIKPELKLGGAPKETKPPESNV